ncbi:SAM-dependent methyltransferase [Actinoplanes sp. NPDC026619]|uniref:class I SAM-dependent methyltransferase n=1 Tax=Actinoplanes sp. NPDC026619 TaxID=3155798 RepID=UPI00340FA9E7
MSSAHARAVHQIADSASVFPDPLAVRIAGMDPDAPARGGMPPAVRMFMAIRHRLAEDRLARAGAAQVVILGAGLDTFAYRNPYPEMRVFEVDQPDTQAWKRKRLADAGIAVPGNVVYCPVDLSDIAALEEAGFDRRTPSFFASLGVVPYLAADVLVGMLRFVAGLEAPAELVFDYNQPRATLPPRRQEALAEVAAGLARGGEPWRSFFATGEMAALLMDAGFDAVEDLGWDECLQRYAVDPGLPDLFGGRIVTAGRGAI